MMDYKLFIQCGIVAYVYCEVLIMNGHLLHGFYSELQGLLTKQIEEILPDNAPPEVKELPGYQPVIRKRIIKRESWIMKPLGACPLCTAGHMALHGLWIKWLLPQVSTLAYNLTRTAWHMITTICAAILLVMILQSIIGKWQPRKP